MLRPTLITASVLALLVLAPGCLHRDDHSHGATGQAHEDHGHGHEPSELPTRAVTIHTAKSELFAEHPFLVVGHEAPFAAHLTDLKDFSPVTEGKLEAVLTSPEGREEVFPIEGVLRPGIFRPVVTPQAPGNYRLSFRLTSPKLSDVIEAGAVTVYADEASALKAAPEEAENPAAISFLKEQQWKIAFETQRVQRGSLDAGITLQGTVKAANGREVAVVSPGAGRIAIGYGRLPKLGDTVRAGEVLAALTPVAAVETDRAGLAQAVASAEASLKQARRELARAERLVAEQAAPSKRGEEARTTVAIAEASLKAAKHRLAAKAATLAGTAGVSEESYHLKAPISGTVVAASLVPGAFVEAGAPLYQIVDLSRVWVEARVPEVDLNRVVGAKRAEITVPGAATVTVGGKNGGLVTVGGVLDPATRTAPAIFAVPNPDGRFRIGMTAEVRALTGSTAPSPVIPRSAVVDDNGRPIAYVQTGGESFERRELKLEVKQGDRVQVTSGLEVGERVVTQGGYEIRLTTLSDAVPDHGHAH